jgi:uncharacterized membrane protein YkoI
MTSFRKALVGAALLGATAAGGAFAATALADGTGSGTDEQAAALVDDGSTTTATDDASTGATDDTSSGATDGTTTDDDGMPGHHHGGGGPHGHGKGHGAGEGREGEEPLTGDTLSQATAAAQAAVPDATVERAETDADGAVYEVHMEKADGSHVTVKLNADFTVASIEEGR